MPIEFKSCALKKLSALKTMDTGGGEHAKMTALVRHVYANSIWNVFQYSGKCREFQ